MSKVKVTKKKKAEIRKEWPAVVYFWAFGLAIASFMFVEVIFHTTLPHPIHWLAGLIGGSVGIGAGWIWYRWRGDVY
jgi:hypothetical protein